MSRTQPRGTDGRWFGTVEPEPARNGVTIPGVELMRVGSWQAQSGPFTVSRDLISHAVRAYQSGRIGDPVIKIGHDDRPGAPAVGRVRNLRASADGSTLLGDLHVHDAGLAAAMGEQFPNRSIEGEFDYRDGTGTVWPFAVTCVALLGAVAPAVHGLAEIARSVAASSGRRVVWLASPSLPGARRRQFDLAKARRRRRNRTINKENTNRECTHGPNL